MSGHGIAARIILASLAAAALGIGILALGVTVIGSATFTDAMVRAGDTADHAREMFEGSVTGVVAAAALVALAASVILAVLIGRRLARPLEEISLAAKRVARGEYETRVARRGPGELTDLADAFNQMAGELEFQEQTRRDFIANAAHELRTPLTNLKGYLEALRDDVLQADRAAYTSLLEETDRLIRLSRSLDTLAAGDAADSPRALEEVELTEAVAFAVDMVRPMAEQRGLALEVDQPASARVRGRRDDLAQVLVNLLTNAVLYTPAQGAVTVQVDARPTDVLVSIANTSEPIPAEDLARVFQRFYRVEKSRDRARGGAGIGLAIVKQLVESAGGRVGAESRDGKTRFWFTMPA